MKVISGGHNKVARVDCSCCGSYHNVEIFFNKQYDSKDESDYLFEFQFNWGNCTHDYPDLKTRIRNIKYLLFNKDSRENVDAILLDPSQIVDLLTLMATATKDLVSEDELLEILKGENVKMATWQDKNSNWYNSNLFRNSDNIGLDYSFHNEDGPVSEFGFLDGVLELGFYQDTEEWSSTNRSRAWNYLMKYSKMGYREMYCSLTKDDTIEFMRALAYIVNCNNEAKNRITEG